MTDTIVATILTGVGTTAAILFGVWRMCAHYAARKDADLKLDRRIDALRRELDGRIDWTNERIDSVRDELRGRIDGTRDELRGRIDRTNERINKTTASTRPTSASTRPTTRSRVPHEARSVDRRDEGAAPGRHRRRSPGR